MKAQKRSRAKKFYTVDEANATLPLLRSILRDITELAHELRERNERLNRVQVPAGATLGDAHREELKEMHAELERGQERMREFEQELKNLNVELKDYFTGLIDFPCWLDGRAVYLCWRLGESEIAFWHELDSGFAGRKRLAKELANGEQGA
jgi:hypothetical protein